MKREPEASSTSGTEARRSALEDGIFSLRRLRWKLTLSYTLVTVLALLLAELVLLAALVGLLASPLLPRLVAEDLADQTSRLEPGLDGEAPDTEQLQQGISALVSESDMPGDGSPPGEMQESPEEGFSLIPGPENGYLFVVDDERNLLATSREIRASQEGERLDADAFPGLAPLLEEALDGGENPWQLGDYSPDWSQMLVTAPLEGGDGEVRGAAVSVIELPNLTAPLLVVALVVAVMLLGPAALLGTVFGLFTAWTLTRRLQRLAGAAQAWSRGDFSVVARDRSRDELGQLSRELNRMARELESLIQTRGELATLETRNRFARDLHDSVKQQVFATSLQIATTRKLMERDPQAAGRHLQQADELVRQAQKELNVLIHEMRPAALEDKGLATAVRDYAGSWSRGSEIPASVQVRGERETPLEVEQAVFRVFQEALANAAKHSGATQVRVDLGWEGKMLRLHVTDDGEGFVASEKLGPGFGLESMHERMARIGGHVNIESTPGEGTRVECFCPIQRTRDRKEER